MLDKNTLLKKETVNKLKTKGFEFNQNDFIELNNLKANLQLNLEKLKQEKNQIAKIMAKGFDKNLVEKGKEINKAIKEMEIEFTKINTEFKQTALHTPNIPYEKCPIGNNEDDNVEIKRFGEIKNFDFDIRDHVDLGYNLKDKIDFKKANQLVGKNRFVILKNNMAKLHRALINFMLEQHIQKDYIEYEMPLMVNKEALIGTGQLPKFYDEQFKIEGEDLYLIPTGEVPLTNIFKNDIFDKEDLPIKVTANTHCFRKEAGAYGQDTKGMIRQHQFNKVELVQLTTKENANNALNEVLADAEQLLQLLELPYRVVELCTGDLGFAAKKTFDIEVWIPSQNKYREISSCSWFGDFQARRINIKYRNNKNKEYVHTINGSGLAVGRTLVAIVENNQTEEGFIKIPTVLKRYFDNVDYLK